MLIPTAPLPHLRPCPALLCPACAEAKFGFSCKSRKELVLDLAQVGAGGRAGGGGCVRPAASLPAAV